jgi:myo-inositol-1(or 4)-monophosphatase
MRDVNDLVDVAVRAAGRAADYLRDAPRPAPSEWTEKSRHDFVTVVDRTAEQMIAETLLSAMPGSQVIGEELTPDLGPAADGAADVAWVVDPLDGTTNFLHGYPQYAVSIGAVVRGALCVGVILDVARDIVYRAASGQGAWMGSHRLAVSTTETPGEALIGTGFPFKRLEGLDGYLRQFTRVMEATAGIRRAGSAALDLADVAAGRLDAFWELWLAPWDVAAGAVLVREAGGVVTTLDGSADVLGPGSIVAGSPTMHAWLLNLVRNG